MSGRLQGRRIFITGGGSGIGAATARRCAEEGASVAVCDKRAENADAIVGEVSAAGGRAVATPADVGDEAQVEAAIASTVDVFGGLDGVFANAGTAGSGWIHETTLEDWQAVLRVNLTGIFLTAKHSLPHLIAAGGGSMVTTGSIASFVGRRRAHGHLKAVAPGRPSRT